QSTVDDRHDHAGRTGEADHRWDRPAARQGPLGSCGARWRALLARARRTGGPRAPRPATGLPALRQGRDRGTLPFRLHRLQSPVAWRDLPGAVRTGEAAVTVPVRKPVRRRPVFHPLTVAHVHQLTEDSVVVTFDVPDELRATFAFAAGQHLTVRRHDSDGEI